MHASLKRGLILAPATLGVLALNLLTLQPVGASTVYQTTFDNLSAGLLEPSPGASGQDGWYTVQALGSAFGDIQSTVANGGLALHLLAPASNPAGSQTIAQRNLTPPDLAALPRVTLSFDFRAASSDMDAVNSFTASLVAQGGPHPGYEIVAVGLSAGNGTPKSDTGVSIGLSCFNGTNNNEPAPLSVGQGLAWGAWHHVTVAIDQTADQYLWVAVDGAMQSLTGLRLPRSDDSAVWRRGSLIETLTAQIVPDDVGGTLTDDHVYWDNVQLTASGLGSWPMRQRDGANTGRADFSVPASRLNTNFFDIIRWQKPSPDSPADGAFRGTSMVFFDGAGPGGADLVAGGYHWPKGVQGMDRHTGAVFWSGNPDGGEFIGDATPAFSPSGATVYVVNDATSHPLMAFAASNGPAVYWHNGADSDPNKLSSSSAKVAPDGRIFAAPWDDRIYAGTDSGTSISLSWSAASSVCACYSTPALWQDTNRLVVVSAGRCSVVKAWDGTSGAELWSVELPGETDADATIDPASGKVFLPIGTDSIWVVGLDKDGHPLWSAAAAQVFAWQTGLNPQRAQSAGCLAADGLTYYFQTVSEAGDGQLYAIRTADGSLKWTVETGSRGWEEVSSSPIVSSNGLLIVGNNDGGAYLAILDAQTNGVLLATLPVGSGGNARASATLSSEGLLYLPARLDWTRSNGDCDVPTHEPANAFTAFDLNEHPGVPPVIGTLYVNLCATNASAGSATWTNQGTLGRFTRNGSPSFAADVANTGIPGVYFNGVDACYQGPASVPDLEGSSDRSVELWVFNPDILEEETLVAWGHRGGPDGSNFAINYGTSQDYGAASHWGWDLGWGSPDRIPASNAWHHFVYTCNGGTICKFYVDGQLVIRRDDLGPLLTHAGNAILVGAQHEDETTLSYLFSGYLNTVRVYGGVLSSNEVAAQYASGPARMNGPSTKAVLTVVSAHGTPVPGTGQHEYTNGQTVVCSMPVSTVVEGETEYSCAGWLGSGSVSGGSGQSVTFTITADSTLTWVWSPSRHYLALTASSGGHLTADSQWLATNSQLTVAAVADAGWQFVFWSGDTNGCVVNHAQIQIAVDQPRHIAAHFTKEGPDVLELAQSGNQLLLSWPQSSCILVVEQTDSLQDGGVWTRTAVTPTLANGWNVVALDATCASRFFRLRRVTCGDVPPDPIDVAPSFPNGAIADFGSATEFLYTGAYAVQTGVTNGTIQAERSAVIRGVVKQQSGAPFLGVAITVLGHPEYGQTYSRADGQFDLAVNGGGSLTVKYARTGYLTAQRQVTVPWQDSVTAPAVVLVALDPVVTPVVLGTNVPAQVVRGSVVVDADGSRQATVVLPPAVQARVVFADGSTQSVSALSLRATELTVGTNGPSAMPAALPPTSAYTYCVDLTADETLALDTASIQFSEPVPFYVNNFLGMPVGIQVPVGYYDKARGVWVPSPDGRVIKILGSTGGLADVDITGSGQPANATALASLGITTAERQKLAGLYVAGTSLWRAQLPHFSSCDLNYSVVLPSGAVPPDRRPPAGDRQLDQNEATRQDGYGSLEVENQVFHERIGLVGTPFSLCYSSDRVPGAKAANTIEIPLSGDTLPPALLRIDLEVSVAGRLFKQSFARQTNLTHVFQWDGQDAYGRSVSGIRVASIRIGYVYQGVYALPASTVSFAAASGIPITNIIPARTEMVLWQELSGKVGHWLADGLGLAGWTLNAHHTYDPVGRTLHFGGGGRTTAQGMIGNVMTTVAGGGDTHEADGIPALSAAIYDPKSVAVAPDGTLYFMERERMMRVDPDGLIHTLAGGGSTYLYMMPPEGLPGRQLLICCDDTMALAPDGRIFLSSVINHKIYTLGPDGMVRPFAGKGFQWPPNADGLPALQTTLYETEALGVGPDGSVYVAGLYDYGADPNWRDHNRIRQISPDGLARTIAGPGYTGIYGIRNEVPARQTDFADIMDLKVGPDGSVYLTSGTSVRRITPDGIIHRVAGWETNSTYSGDGGPAIQAGLGFVCGMALAPNGGIYLTTATNYMPAVYFSHRAGTNNSRIRYISPDGIITTVAGTGAEGFSGDGGPPTQANINSPYGIAVAPDGTVYFADYGNRRIRRFGPALAGFSGSTITIPSSDGSEVYQFNAQGRHLRTLDALTGSLRYEFSYNSLGLLSAVTDAFGNQTRIDRNAAGEPVAIVAPFGQRTILRVDSAGLLTYAANAANETNRLAYLPGGLLSAIAGPGGATYSVAYDSAGRVTRASDPAGGWSELARTVVANGAQVASTSADGYVSYHSALNLPDGTCRQVSVATDGRLNEKWRTPSGAVTNLLADGTRIISVRAPDPRFGMLAPLVKSQTIITPGGLVSTGTTERVASLAVTNDPLSLVSLTTRLTRNGGVATTVYTASNRTLTATTPMNRIASAQLDGQGRVVRRERPSLEPILFEYDEQGRMVSQSVGTGAVARVTRYRYGAAGFMEEAVDPLGRTNHFTRDAVGRLTENRFPDGRAARFAYDTLGNLLSITPPGREPHNFAYTPVNAQSRYQPPAAPGASAPVLRFYNADRQPVRFVRADGLEITNSYATTGQLLAVAMADGQYTYSYNGNGQLASITSPSDVSLVYGYDGRFVTSAAWSGSVTGSVARAYDNDFRLRSLSFNGGVSTTFDYDLDGLLTRAGALNVTRAPDNGVIIGTQHRQIADTYTYNAFGEVVHYSATGKGALLLEFDYTYDGAGRIVEIRETLTGTITTNSYAYDAAGRLAEVRRNGMILSTYQYDSNGNRTGHAGTNGVMTADFDTQDRLLAQGGSTYEHNAHGERTRRVSGGRSTAYRYDALGTLREATLSDGTRINYIVDGHEHLAGKLVNGVLAKGFLFDGVLNLAAELDANLEPLNQFVYGTAAHVPDYFVRQGVLYRILSDHLGSPRLIINADTAEVAQRLDYDEYGCVVQDTNPGFQPFGFAGGLYDPDTGLVHFLARVYDAETARWTSKDPTRFAGGDLNLYTYAGGDPVNLTDITGLGPETEMVLGLTAVKIKLASGNVGEIIPTLLGGGACEDASEQRSELLKKTLSKFSKDGNWDVTIMKQISDAHTMNLITYSPNDNPSLKMSFLVDNYVGPPVITPVVHTGIQSHTLWGNPGELVTPLNAPSLLPLVWSAVDPTGITGLTPWDVNVLVVDSGPMIVTGR